MKNLIFLVALTTLLSCNGRTDRKAAPDIAGKSSTIQCYLYTGNRDTVRLSLVDSADGFITGTLGYNLYEKDKNYGTVRGKMKGDLFIARYRFRSEGTVSVRQVIFKKNGNTFQEGYGDMTPAADGLVFKNTDSLRFDNSIILKEAGCDE